MVPAQFAHQLTRLQFPKDVHFGDDVTIWIAKAGDVAIGKMYLRVDWPEQAPVQNSVGTYMIDYVELLYENQLIERHYGESLELWNDITVTQSKQSALTTLVGKGLTDSLDSYYIPIPFSVDLPLCALKKPPVFRVKFKSANEFTVLNWTLPIQVNLFVDYVYVTKAERDYMKKTPMNYLAKTWQRVIYTVSAGETEVSVLTDFVHSVKELFWVIQNDGTSAYNYLNAGGDQLVNMKLTFNGAELIKREFGTPLYLRIVQPLEYHTRTPDHSFYMYSFAIDPEHEDATGEVNMSLVTRQIHTLTLTPCPYSRSLRIYALGYNVISVKDGDLRALNVDVREGGQDTVITAEKIQNNSYPGLYPFDTFTFTSLGNTGRQGPTSNTYPTQPVPVPVPWTEDSQWYITKGVQYWTAPANGVYQVTAAGAMGEASGRIIQGNVAFYEGQVLKLSVGQLPVSGLAADHVTTGAGGCSSISTDANVPILVGAGGDGGIFNPWYPAVPNENITEVGGGGYVITTMSPHGFPDGLYVNITGGTVMDGSYQIQVVDDSTFAIGTIPGLLPVPIDYPDAGTTAPESLPNGNITGFGAGAQVTTIAPHGFSTGLYVTVSGGTIFDGSYQINVVSNVAFQIQTSVAGSIDFPDAGVTVPAAPQNGVFQPYGNGQGGGTGLGVAGAGYYTDGQYPDQTFPFLLPKAIVTTGYGNQYVYGGNYNPQPGIPPPPSAPVAEGGFGGGQCPINLVSNIVSISNQGPYPLIPGSNIYAVTTEQINGLPQGYLVYISGVLSAEGDFNGPNLILAVPSIQTVALISSAVEPFVLNGATIYGAAFGVAGGGGYSGSPGNGLQGATCYASDQVTNVQDLGLNADSGYITISLVQ
jgi:hypothetical protein